MALVIEVDELDAGGCLAAFDQLRSTRDAAERDILLVATQLADIYDVDSRAGELVIGLAGREQPVRLGGDGTPLVWEFAVAEAATALAMTTWSTRRLMADALDIRHRLPRLWRGLDHGTVIAALARKVAQATRDLTPAAAGTVDEHITGYADGRLPFTRFLDRLDGLVVAADPITAAAREHRARTEEYARVGQTNDHGQKTLYVRTGAAQMTRIDATIAYYADALAHLGDTDPLEQRRSKAVLLLANPTQAVALLQALHGPTDDEIGTDTTRPDDPGNDRPDPADDVPASDPAGGTSTGRPNAPPPPPPPDWDDELDLDLPDGVGEADRRADPAPHDGEPGDRPSDDEPDRESPAYAGTADPGTDARIATAGTTDDTRGSRVPGETSAQQQAPPGQSPGPSTGQPPGPSTQPDPDQALKPFFTPFRPDQPPPCPCRGGGFQLDPASMLPTVTLYLHAHAETLARGPGVLRWEGEGPITSDYLRHILGPHARFTVRPVIDPETISPADAYEIPRSMAEALHLRTPYDVFPYGVNTTRGKQKDHTIAYHPTPDGTGDDTTDDTGGGKPTPGQTGLHNLGGMTGYHHRVKTHGRGWKLAQPFPGVYLWRTPHGAIYYVDNTGTRQLTAPATDRLHAAARPTPHTPAPAEAAEAAPTAEAAGAPDPLGQVLHTAIDTDESPSLTHFRRYLETAPAA